MKNKILSFSIGGVGMLLSTGFTISVQAAELKRVSSVGDFYEAYGPSDSFSPESKAIIDGLFGYADPFMGASGLQNAAAAGYVPMTKDLRFHGTHWFNPALFLSNSSPNPLAPTGLNFDQQGKLVAVFWPEQKYAITAEVLNSLATADPASLPALYEGVKTATLKSKPDILDPFGDVDWHSHENVLIENVGNRDPATGAYTGDVLFRQSLTNENFVGEVLAALADPEVTIAPFEFSSDPSVYPPFNTLADAGFYMAHMWLGLENPDGLFAGTHPAVSIDAPGEHTTFEGGSGGHHGHSPDPGHEKPGHVSVPEPSFVLALLVVGAFGFRSRRRQLQHQP